MKKRQDPLFTLLQQQAKLCLEAVRQLQTTANGLGRMTTSQMQKLMRESTRLAERGAEQIGGAFITPIEARDALCILRRQKALFLSTVYVSGLKESQKKLSDSPERQAQKYLWDICTQLETLTSEFPMFRKNGKAATVLRAIREVSGRETEWFYSVLQNPAGKEGSRQILMAYHDAIMSANAVADAVEDAMICNT